MARCTILNHSNPNHEQALSKSKHLCTECLLLFQNFYIEILTPDAMILGSGAFGR